MGNFIKKIEEVAQKDIYQGIINSDDCYVKNAIDAFQLYINYKIENQDIEYLINNLEQESSIKEDANENITDDEQEKFNLNFSKRFEKICKTGNQKKFVNILYNLIAQVDMNAANKSQYNPNGIVAIGKTGIRQNMWVENLLKYKRDNNDSNINSNNIKNCIVYLNNPEDKYPILQEDHYIKIEKYIPELLTTDWNICKNKANNTYLIKEILYGDMEIRNLWDKKELKDLETYEVACVTMYILFKQENKILCTFDDLKNCQFTKEVLKIQEKRNFQFPSVIKKRVDKLKNPNIIIENNEYKLTNEGLNNSEKLYKELNLNYVTNNEKEDTIMEQPLNQILYGPPGTGKTYELENIAEKYIHPQVEKEYDKLLSEYDLNWAEKIVFAYKINNPQNKPLTDIQISKLPLIQRWYLIGNSHQSKTSLKDSIRGEMQVNAIKENGEYSGHENDYFKRCENGFVLIDDGEKIYNEICKNKNINIEPLKKEYYYNFCTFHQSYSYEEFVEGIRPVIVENNEEKTPNDSTSKNMQFDYHCGIFKKMCIRARKEPNKKFFIFIDEINRGNISKIFGELITLIEKDKREKVFDDGEEYHTIEVTLPYTNDRFTVPNNLYIIGTMNTADKSLALLDVALRRRFEFIPMYPKYIIKDENGNNLVRHSNFLKSLNEEILKKKQSADYMIGHSYFMNDKSLEEILNHSVIPLLMEYFNTKVTEVKILLDKIADITYNSEYLYDNNKYFYLKVETATERIKEENQII